MKGPTEEESKKFREMEELEKEIAQLKIERDNISSELAAITRTGTHTAPFRPGNTDQFDMDTTEYKEFTDPVKGAELTSKLREIESKIDRNQKYRDHLMAEVVRKRIERENAENYKSQMETQRAKDAENNKQQQNHHSFFDRLMNNNTSTKNMTQQRTSTRTTQPTTITQQRTNTRATQPTSHTSTPASHGKSAVELMEEQRKSAAFKQVKQLYKKADLRRRLSAIIDGKTVNLNKVFKNATAEELENLIAIRLGTESGVKSDDRFSSRVYGKGGKSYSEIEKIHDNSHWRKFLNELNEIEKRSKNGTRGR